MCSLCCENLSDDSPPDDGIERVFSDTKQLHFLTVILLCFCSVPFDLCSVSLCFCICNSVTLQGNLELSYSCSDILITGTVFL